MSAQEEMKAKDTELMKRMLDENIEYDYTVTDGGGLYDPAIPIIKVVCHSLIILVAWDRDGYVLEEFKNGKIDNTTILDQVSADEVMKRIHKRM